jgi:hypothetical protein
MSNIPEGSPVRAVAKASLFLLIAYLLLSGLNELSKAHGDGETVTLGVVLVTLGGLTSWAAWMLLRRRNR